MSRARFVSSAFSGLLVAFALALGACANSKPESGPKRAQSNRAAESSEPIQPIPEPPKQAPGLVALGRKLFNDSRFSADGTRSCASCHVLGEGGEDGRARSLGVRDQLGEINTPTVLNASLNFVQFWDGRAATLEDQINGPVEHPLELGSRWSDVVARLSQDTSLSGEFKQQFSDGVTAANIRVAIAAFERSLVTPGASFDRWLQGDKAALTADELRGYELFKAVGCVACHQGRNLGGNMFQRFGVMGDYFRDRGGVNKADYGRFNVTGVESDRFTFRVPSLRNVELTAPYFHDGTAPTLDAAVRVMAKYQLGRQLSDDQIGLIVAFLKTLTGTLPEKSAGKPGG